jgi:hypothetical protein
MWRRHFFPDFEKFLDSGARQVQLAAAHTHTAGVAETTAAGREQALKRWKYMFKSV